MILYYYPMKKIIFVVFCLLLSTAGFADELETRLQRIETVWTHIDGNAPKAEQMALFKHLLGQTTVLANAHPARAEPLIMQACIILTSAKIQSPFKALASVKRARRLLQKALSINPMANNGSALVTLGVLYYKVPGWPIAFGDDNKAEQLLTKALQYNPQGIDSNFFFGDFLLSQDKLTEAASYLKKAAAAPVLADTSFTNVKLKAKAREMLESIVASNADISVNIHKANFKIADMNKKFSRGL